MVLALYDHGTVITELLYTVGLGNDFIIVIRVAEQC